MSKTSLPSLVLSRAVNADANAPIIELIEQLRTKGAEAQIIKYLYDTQMAEPGAPGVLVQDIADHLNLGQPVVSNALTRLRRKKIVASVTEGRTVRNFIPEDVLYDTKRMLTLLQEIATQRPRR